MKTRRIKLVFNIASMLLMIATAMIVIVWIGLLVGGEDSGNDVGQVDSGLIRKTSDASFAWHSAYPDIDELSALDQVPLRVPQEDSPTTLPEESIVNHAPSYQLSGTVGDALAILTGADGVSQVREVGERFDSVELIEVDPGKAILRDAAGQLVELIKPFESPDGD